MDLVACYDSDDSGANKSKTPTNFSNSSKEVDIIELDDSDTDDELRKVQNTSDDNPQKNSKTNDIETSAKEIVCIDIDSDIEEESIANPKDNISPTTSKENRETDKLNSEKIDYVNLEENTSLTSKEKVEADKFNSKKVDYLNLEGNDSEEEEEQVTEANVSKLLSSAAVLSNVPCGPEKNVSANQCQEDASTNRNKLDFESPTPCSSSSYNFDSSSDKNIPKCENVSSVREKSPVFTDGVLHKRFKRDASTPGAASVTCADLGEIEEYGLSSYMYRKDERITGAFAKSVACRLPRQITRHLISHVNSVTALQWCIPQYSHLLLSASADCTAKIWDMYCKNPIQTVKDNLGIKAAKWSLSGEQIYVGGYGKKARVFDVLSGKEIISYDIYNYVHSIEIHPYIEDILLCGTRNAIFGFDLRVNSTLPIRTYLSKCEEVLDIAFLDENEFICSTNIVSHDSADRTIMVWDFSSGAIMSNQVFLERYTCPSLKVHPNDSSFIAQTNGDYIASFSSLNPYKIKEKRYMGHKVAGFGVECDISPDGKYIASGDANGDVYFYNYSNTNVITKLKVRPNMATNRLKWHPALNSTLATATWDGHIQIWK